MKKAFDIGETILNACGVIIGVSNLEDILNIILLIVSICAILFRGIYAVYSHIKTKEYDKIAHDLDDTKEELEQLNHKEDK